MQENRKEQRIEHPTLKKQKTHTAIQSTSQHNITEQLSWTPSLKGEHIESEYTFTGLTHNTLASADKEMKIQRFFRRFT